MHLKSLTIKNFKSHADTTIEFDNVTSIVGKNNSGKTNILRALKVLLHHTDWPSSWIRYGQDSASIELVLSSGHIITRSRTKSKQSVTIKTAGKIETLDGKKDAKDFIEKAVGIKKITLDETTGPEDLNFVDVYDGPYLIGGRPDTVQRKISGIVGANIIDDARVRILKKIRDQESQLTDLDTTTTELSSIIDSETKTFNVISNSLNEIQDLYKHWNDNDSNIKEIDNFIKHIDLISSLIPNDNVVENITKLYASTTKTKVKLEALELENKDLLLLEDRLKKVAVPDLDSVEQSLSKVTNLTQQLELIEEALTILQLEEEIKLLDKELEDTLNHKELKLKELGICPMCSSVIKK